MDQLSDSELVRQVETCTLPKGALTHRNHVRLAWLYLEADGPSHARQRFARAVERYAISVGALDKFDQALTAAWLDIIDAARSTSRAGSFEAFIAEHPELLNRALVPRSPAPV